MSRRRRRARALLAVLLVLALAACTGGGSTADDRAADKQREAARDCDGTGQPPEMPTPAPPDGQADEIVIATDEDISFGHARHELIRRWNATHPVKARLVEQQRSTDQVHASLAAAAQNGYPRYDLMLVDTPRIAEFAKHGYIRALDGNGFNRAAFFPGSWRAGCYQGHLYAVPLVADAGMLYRRTDLDVPRPGSWADLAAGSPVRPVGVRYTMVTQLRDYEGLTINAFEAIWSAGGHIVDDQAILDDRAREGLTDLVRAARPDGPVGSTDFDENATLSAFRDGAAAYMRNWPYAHDLIPTTGPNRIDFAVEPLPWQSVQGGWSLVVSADSPRPAEAVELIQFLTMYESQKYLFDHSGLVAVRPAVYDDPAVRAHRPYAAQLRDAVAAARPRPVTPYYGQVSQAVQQALTRLLTAERFDQAAVDRELDALEGALRDALRGR